MSHLELILSHSSYLFYSQDITLNCKQKECHFRPIFSELPQIAFFIVGI